MLTGKQLCKTWWFSQTTAIRMKLLAL